MKSLVYQLREDVIASFNNLVEVFSKNNNPLLPHAKKELKKIKDPTISPVEIIDMAESLTSSAVEMAPKVFLDGSKEMMELFYRALSMTYKNEWGYVFPKKYYYFVPDFAKSLQKVKIPNFDKLTLNEVFPDIETNEKGGSCFYFEIIFKDEVLSFIVHRNDKKQIDGFMCLYYPIWTHFKRSEITAPLPTYFGEYDRNDKDIGNDLFKDAWEKCSNTKEVSTTPELSTGTSFVASCLLYLQSGDPDIRHMKGENPRKYKINSRDSFFEKRQKQVLSQDAVFNDYELVGWNYKKQYNVAGHWRYQACGPKWSQHKLIFIESFKKGKKSD
jgi:hypothetical protein